MISINQILCIKLSAIIKRFSNFNIRLLTKIRIVRIKRFIKKNRKKLNEFELIE
ncbi:MAG: hypothetical protein RLZZ414_723 [Bacteroidota bacterium]|jgi:hypothetical protein